MLIVGRRCALAARRPIPASNPLDNGAQLEVEPGPRMIRSDIHISLQLRLIAVVLAAVPIIAHAENLIRVEVPVFAGGEGMDFFNECAAEYNKIQDKVFVDLYGDPRID